MEKITGILLAGGRSSRMGSDKGLLDFRGRLLAEYPLALLQKHCGTIIISSNNPEYGQFGYPVVADERMDCGPAGALATTLSRPTATGTWYWPATCLILTMNWQPFCFGRLPERQRPLFRCTAKGWNRWLRYTIKICNRYSAKPCTKGFLPSTVSFRRCLR